MTTEELDAVADALRVLVVEEAARPAATKDGPSRGAAHRVNMQLAKAAADRFNLQLDAQRLLLERACEKHDAGERVPDDLRVQLMAAAVLYKAERLRIEERFGLRARR
jgi:hypothetical protein